MLYGSSEQWPGQSSEGQEDESAEAEVTQKLIHAAEQVAVGVSTADGVTPELLAAVGKAIDGYSFRMGRAKWDPRMEQLNAAAIRYCDYFPDAFSQMFTAEVPF